MQSYPNRGRRPTDNQQRASERCLNGSLKQTRRAVVGISSTTTTAIGGSQRQIALTQHHASPPSTPATRISRQSSGTTSGASGPLRTRQPRARATVSSSGPKGEQVELSSWISNRRLRIGIETEFILTPHDPKLAKHRGHLKDLWKAIAQEYHAEVDESRPRLLESLRPYDFRGSYDSWCFVNDPSLSKTLDSSFAIELVSPIFDIAPGSRWRDDVTVFWNFLRKDYGITTDETCGTHIHLSLEPGYSAIEIKRVAQAIIHFEAAFEALVPMERRGIRAAKSNWIDTHTVHRKARSRWELIDDIEHEGNLASMIGLMQEKHDRNFCWNFHSLFRSGTLEFRKPPPCTTPEQSLAWAELAIGFVQASVQYGSLWRLRSVPATVGGLRWFISRFGVEGINEADRMQTIWAGKGLNTSLQPLARSPPRFLTKQIVERKNCEAMLKGLLDADKKQSDLYAKSARPPYW